MAMFQPFYVPQLRSPGGLIAMTLALTPTPTLTLTMALPLPLPLDIANMHTIHFCD
jgi:hypothetical protein